MHYGVCGGPELAAPAAQAGFDFVEWTVGALLAPREPPAAFTAALEKTRAAPLPFPVVNCFVPGDLKITGPDASLVKLEAYVIATMARAREARVDHIVFGSGGARQIPDGFDRVRAHRQLVAFGAMLAPIAGDHGVTVVVEPLNRAECNVLTTVDECAALVREVGHPALRLLVDAYHLMKDQDSVNAMVTHADLLAHVHLATVPGRLAPGAEACDLDPFFRALARARYQGRLSIESGLPDPPRDLPRALAVMKAAEKRARNHGHDEG